MLGVHIRIIITKNNNTYNLNIMPRCVALHIF